MTELKQYWLADAEGNYALVTGADERDRWVPLGWTETEEPADGWVHIWHEGIEQPGKPVPVAALHELWGPIGWVAGPPPGGTSPFAPEAPAAPPAEPKPEPKPAAGGTAKEK